MTITSAAGATLAGATATTRLAGGAAPSTAPMIGTLPSRVTSTEPPTVMSGPSTAMTISFFRNVLRWGFDYWAGKNNRLKSDKSSKTVSTGAVDSNTQAGAIFNFSENLAIKSPTKPTAPASDGITVSLQDSLNHKLLEHIHEYQHQTELPSSQIRFILLRTFSPLFCLTEHDKICAMEQSWVSETTLVRKHCDRNAHSIYPVQRTAGQNIRDSHLPNNPLLVFGTVRS